MIKIKDAEKIIKNMKNYLTNMQELFTMDKKEVEIILNYIKELNELKDMYGYFLSVISSNIKRFKEHRENKHYRIIDFDRYDKIVEDIENE